MPDLGIAELLHPHVAPEAKAILVAQMRWQAVGRKIDLLHWRKTVSSAAAYHSLRVSGAAKEAV
ncbi:MAG: hypothetical protein EOQ44_01825 [Mesorhizobium sp.]|nr:hypothetical protein EJ072_11120 [Mesorhizobium sp. M2A.F.Ca.ET.046.03.2.1]RWB49861.1 MAG: hypothetical protein EOQ44_01825 [Mesorhizobium sp.]